MNKAFLLIAAIAVTAGVKLNQKIDLRRPTAIRKDLQIDYLEGNALLGLPRACAASVTDSSVSSAQDTTIVRTLKVVYDQDVDYALRRKGLQPAEDICVDVVRVLDSKFGATTMLGPYFYGRSVIPEKPVANHDQVPRLQHMFCSAAFVTAPEPSTWDLASQFRLRTNKAMPDWPMGTPMEVTDETQSLFSPAATNFQIIGVPASALESDSGLLKLGVAAATDLFSRCHYASFKNQDALPTLTNLQRQVYIPNYGSMVQMTESYELENLAPALWDEFSPSDVGMIMQRYVGTRRYRTRDLTGLLALFELPAHLPPGVRNFEYYDAIGNISTSFVEPTNDGGYRVTLEPRYPVIGGWKASFELRYDIPLAPLHRRRGAVDELKVSLAPSIWPLWTEQQTLDILLPPKSTIVSVETPGIELSQETLVEKRWLDLFTSRKLLRLRFGPLRMIEGSGGLHVTVRYTQQRLLSQVLQLLSIPTLLISLLAMATAPVLLRRLPGGRAVYDPIEAIVLFGDLCRLKFLRSSGTTDVIGDIQSAIKGGFNEAEIMRHIKKIEEGPSPIAERRVLEGLVSLNQNFAETKKE